METDLPTQPTTSQPAITQSSPTAQSPLKSNPRLSKWIVAFAILFVLVIAGGIAAYFLNKHSVPKNQNIIQTLAKPTSSPTIAIQPLASSSAETANWKTYTRIVPADKTQYYNDPEFKITMQYPTDWTLKESHTLSNRVVDKPEEINTAVFTGKEGKITIEWGPMGFGGGCDPSMHTIFHIKNMAVNICHTVNSDGTEGWSGIDSINQNQPAEANATANLPLSINSPIIKAILSTLAFY